MQSLRGLRSRVVRLERSTHAQVPFDLTKLTDEELKVGKAVLELLAAAEPEDFATFDAFTLEVQAKLNIAPQQYLWLKELLRTQGCRL